MNSAYSEVTEMIKELAKQLKKEVDSLISEEIEIPEWENIQNKRKLYSAYREAVVRNDQINKQLSKVGNAIMSIRELKNSLRVSETLPISLLKPVKDSIERDLEKLYDYQKILLCHKDSYDQVLRFFVSAQYILSSPRLMGMD